MKKFLVIGFLTLSLCAVPQQRASAWIKLNFSFGLNIGFEFGHHCHHPWPLFSFSPPVYPSDVFNYYGGPQWANPTCYSYYPVTYAAQPVMPQQHYQTPQPPRYTDARAPVTYSDTNQPVSYYYPSATYNHQSPAYSPSWGSYSQYQMPSYWYGY